ncbi:ATP-binding cassette domain-containing protein [Jatrophihabitans sp.]|uniref:ABC transporter ATP-binding protein n=1 Tax=Jatrophihabitans sp. TaxID=1932789 RepID=UPI0030C6CB78
MRDVSLEVRAGQVVALLGPNGAGKTTTLLAMAGDLTPLSGEVWWLGERSRAPLFKRARSGLRFITEERSVFMGLSAQENLEIGGGDIRIALELFPELVPLLPRAARLLSGGEQQMLTLARALSAQPRALIADELSLGLAPVIVKRLLAAVRRAADAGTAVLIVEQQTHAALEVADEAYVLRRGRIEMSGRGAELRERRSEIESLYLSN